MAEERTIGIWKAVRAADHHRRQRARQFSAQEVVDVFVDELAKQGYQVVPFAPDHPYHPDKQVRRNG